LIVFTAALFALRAVEMYLRAKQVIAQVITKGTVQL